MAEYIDREELLTHQYNASHSNWPQLAEMVVGVEDIEDAPAAEVTPVVHGRWVTHYRSGTPVSEGYVSTCCDTWNSRKSDYCPNCGAKMDGGDGDVDGS